MKLLGQEELANSYEKDRRSSMGEVAAFLAKSQEMKELVENQRKAEARDLSGSIYLASILPRACHHLAPVTFKHVACNWMEMKHLPVKELDGNGPSPGKGSKANDASERRFES